MQAGPLSVLECEQFLIHEARLLDEARFDEWLSLFIPDAWWCLRNPIKRPRGTLSP
jgi:3-phenylpropionate/cinnamic acid dioxygenase small subunit